MVEHVNNHLEEWLGKMRTVSVLGEELDEWQCPVKYTKLKKAMPLNMKRNMKRTGEPGIRLK